MNRRPPPLWPSPSSFTPRVTRRLEQPPGGRRLRLSASAHREILVTVWSPDDVVEHGEMLRPGSARLVPRLNGHAIVAPPGRPRSRLDLRSASPSHSSRDPDPMTTLQSDMAGIQMPDSAIVRDATEFVRELHPAAVRPLVTGVSRGLATGQPTGPEVRFRAALCGRDVPDVGPIDGHSVAAS